MNGSVCIPVSPEEWAFKFKEMLLRHAEEIQAMREEMYNDCWWTYVDPQDGSDPWLQGPWSEELGGYPVVEIDLWGEHSVVEA
jgi:hypothetical protein